MMVLEALGWALRHVRPSVGWLSFLLVVSAAMLAAGSVVDARWVQGSALLIPMTLLAVLAGAGLAHARVSGRWGAVALAALGVIYLADALAHFLLPLWGGLIELVDAIASFWQFSISKTSFNGAASFSFEQLLESRARLMRLGQRLAAWRTALFIGRIEQNPVAFLFVSGLILWAGAAWAAWHISRRGRALPALLPLGIVLALSTYLGSGNPLYVSGFALCVLVLLPVVEYRRQEYGWERKGADYSPEIGFDVWQVAILVALALIVIGLIAPVVSVPRLANAFWQWVSQPQEAAQAFLTRFFGGVRPESPPTIPPITGVSGLSGSARPRSPLPREHLLGGNPDLSRRRVMSVCIDAPPPRLDEATGVETGPQYGWRQVTYSAFDGQRWFNEADWTVTTAPAYTLLMQAVELHGNGFTATQTLEQRYLVQTTLDGALCTVGEPQFVDQPTTSRWRAAADLIDLAGAGGDYVVISQIPAATAAQLRAAPAVYPARIVETYLALPTDLPERVRELARQVAESAPSAYDKATAIETYLRQFPYDLQVASPPANRDVVDYFLFEAQRGYCDYYASSFVVLARVVGIPARLAVGYAMGRYDAEQDCYAVLEKDAHSWPEVYFPPYGWIAFEPTASMPRFEQPQGLTAQSWQSGSLPLPRRSWLVILREWWSRQWRKLSERGARGGGLVWAAAICGAVLFAAGLAWGQHRWQQARLRPDEAVAAAYDDLCRWGQLLGVRRYPSDTPAEYGQRLSAATAARTARWRWSKRRTESVASQIDQGARTLCEAYQRVSYSPRPASKLDRAQAQDGWQQLWRQIGWLWMISRPGWERK